MVWYKPELSPDSVKALSEKYGCDLITASILLRRGINSGEKIRYYLEDDPRYLRNPYDLPGMEDAVERILAAKEEGEKILVFGDRDVDGITGTALVTDFLRQNGFDVSWRLPMGDEPYGLSVEAVEEFARAYGTLIITVDCGISNVAEITQAAELGVGVVVTDHHNPPENLPPAYALVNPKLPGPYVFPHLSGCAVAGKLVSALRFALRSGVYGQSICFLNARPSNDAMIIEAAKLRNLALIDTLSETVVPGMVRIVETRLPEFLGGQQILCWDLPVQRKLLSQTFGTGVEIQMLDMAEEIGKVIPQTAGKSLLRLREISRIGKYNDRGIGELDVLVNLFVSFVQKKEGFFDEEEALDLQFAALGTIADIMPLEDENRLIVRGGLDSLRRKPRRGLAELLTRLELDPRRLTAGEISWRFTPVINSAGRMGLSEKAVALLLEEKTEERERLAGEVAAMNEKRKRMVEELCFRAEPAAAKSLDTYSGKFTVFAGEGILPGLTGLIAGRMASRFKVPSLVISVTGDTAKGSIRSVREYNLSFLREQCDDLFIHHGGHDFAAGFTIKTENMDAFFQRLRTISGHMELKPEEEERCVIDAEIPLSYLSMVTGNSKVQDKKDLFLIQLADRFEPYGEKNKPLLFLSRGFKITDITLMGKEELRHVKLTLDTGKLKWPAIYWNASGKVRVDFDLGDVVDVVYRVTRNWFNGTETPQMIIEDLRRT
ncbi:MAG: single-stranded-DNA-specific exonuclease RecJ [Spirochaetaceae bacterium]|jgi:single-stranded-DNA-specific exonuclease|nr:single-stranded-DNA-specific exonuclease RecJ [Spirochaetaceae bacterium]